jgi:hypothetical protein
VNSELLRFVRSSLLAFTASLVLVSAAVAGPPLICHPFDIGNAKSLPRISHDWNLDGRENYDTRNLARDTLALLDESRVPLAHMETLRRATLYARSDRAAAKQLLLKLVARAQSSESSPHPDAFALFDAAYLTEAYKQWLGESGENPAHGLAGLDWMNKSVQLRPNDAQIAFGASLIALQGPEAKQREYAHQSIAGAKNDKLLAHNLASHFRGAQSETMAEIILRSNSSKVAKQ